MLDSTEETPVPHLQHQDGAAVPVKPSHATAMHSQHAQPLPETQTRTIGENAPAGQETATANEPSSEPAQADDEKAQEVAAGVKAADHGTSPTVSDMVPDIAPKPAGADTDNSKTKINNSKTVTTAAAGDVKGKNALDQDGVKDGPVETVTLPDMKSKDSGANDVKGKDLRPKRERDRSKDDADKTEIAAATPLPAQQPVATVVTAPAAAPASIDPDDTTNKADAVAGFDSAVAGHKPGQPAAPKGKAEEKSAAGQPASDPQTADAAPAADDDTAESVDSAKPHSEAASSQAVPDPGKAGQDKPDHAHIHDVAASTAARTTANLVHTQSQTQSTDGTAAAKSADGSQLLTMTQQADQPANTPAPAPTVAGNAATPVPLAALAVAIATRAQSGRNRFEIRLDPPELGRIHVRLDVDKTGEVTSHVVVDRVDTLNALQRDATDLQRALQQAGLKTADNGLQFTLRDHSFADRDNSFTAGRPAQFASADPDLAPVDTSTVASYGRLLRPAGGIDIRV